MAAPAPAAVPVAAAAPLVPPPVGGPAGQAQNVVYYVYQMPPTTTTGASNQAMDWSVCFTFYFLRTALNFLNIACWVILLAGTCQLQSNCNKGLFDSTVGYPVPPLAWGTSAPFNLSSGDCGTIYGLLWWSVFLQFTAIVVATLTSISLFTRSKTVRSIFTTTMYFFIMSSVLQFFIADIYNTQTWVLNKRADHNGNDWNKWIAGSTLVLVGSVSSLICNFIWIVWNSYGDIPTLPTSAPAAPTHTDGDAFVAPAEHKATPTVTVAADTV